MPAKRARHFSRPARRHGQRAPRRRRDASGAQHITVDIATFRHPRGREAAAMNATGPAASVQNSSKINQSRPEPACGRQSAELGVRDAPSSRSSPWSQLVVGLAGIGAAVGGSVDRLLGVRDRLRHMLRCLGSSLKGDAGRLDRPDRVVLVRAAYIHLDGNSGVSPVVTRPRSGVASSTTSVSGWPSARKGRATGPARGGGLAAPVMETARALRVDGRTPGTCSALWFRNSSTAWLPYDAA